LIVPDDHETTRISLSGLTAQRVYKLLARTVHLIAIAGLVGGHMFGAPLTPLRPLLYLSIITGAAMCALEAYPNWHSFYEGWALMLWLKLAVLALVPVFWNARKPILIVALVIASVGSHMPRALRHWTPFHK
jgi:hypothetical protein